MATMPAITVSIEPTATRTGYWCETCAKPAVVEIDLVILGDDGVSPFGTFRGCTDCGLPGTLHRGE